MFWRFGFHNASAIESLIDKEASLATILDQDDLLQECKAQNTRLAEYFGRVGVLHRLFAYVTGEIEIEGKDRFKYPYVATEVLCSDIWSISATCVGKSDVVLAPFWDFVLDRSPDDMKTRTVMASHFVKINLSFIIKWPEKMLAFIQSLPNIVERLLRHIECPSFVDLIVQIISLDEHQRCGEVIEWLSSQGFVPRLIDMLSPEHSSDTHNAVADLIKGIISMATPTPASGLMDPAPASNLFARELASGEMTEKLVSYIIHDFSASQTSTNPPPAPSEHPTDQVSTDTTTSTEPPPSNDDDGNNNNNLSSSTQLPSLDSSISSVTNSISIIIELIRKNNSDYFEPYLFHTLRNRLIHFQQHLTEEAGKNPEETREMLEQAMTELVNRMGVVHLGPVLEVIGERMGELKRFLRQPRSLAGNIQTTVGTITPLTFERFRICELFAELLHCSNMALLNRPSIHDNLYDSKGRLQGGLSALEDLAQVIQLNGTSENGDDDKNGGDTTDDGGGNGGGSSDGGMSDIEPAHELPVSNMSVTSSMGGSGVGGGGGDADTPSIGSSDMTDSPGSSDEDDDDEVDEEDVGKMEEIAMHDDGPMVTDGKGRKEGLKVDTSLVMVNPKPGAGAGEEDTTLTSSPVAMITEKDTSNEGGVHEGQKNADEDVPMLPEFDENPLTPQASRTPKTPNSRSSRKTTMQDSSLLIPPDLSNTPGSKLKRWFLDLEILPTLLDLFFEFKWNNFLHSAVYDVVHQILTGNIESGLNRELVISLFKDAMLMHRVVEGQKLNDIESAKPKGVRIGYMGHLTLLAEDVISALDRFPPDLQSLILTTYAPQPEWEEYVKGRFTETKKKDRCALGGPKPSSGVSSYGFSVETEAASVLGGGGGGGAGAGGIGSGEGKGASGGGRLPADESAMFPALRLDDATMGAYKTRSMIEIEQGDVEGERKVNLDVPEDVGTSRGTRGEFKRTGSEGGVRNTADFGPAPGLSRGGDDDDDDDDDEEKYGNSRTTHFARYLAQELQSSNHIGESSDSSDDEEGGWLSQSNFNLGSPPIPTRRPPAAMTERRPLPADASGFDDSFVPSTRRDEDPFSHDDDAFSPFSDAAAAASTSDAVLLSSSFSDEMDDSSFESFGDFGDFQSADGEVDFGPFESASSTHAGDPIDSQSQQHSSSIGGTGSENVKPREPSDDNDDTLTLTPTSGSWTIASGNDGFEEIRRVEKQQGV